MTPTTKDDYSPYVAVAGEGVRFGIVTCKRCGAAVLIMPDENNTQVHDDWHRYLTELLFEDPEGAKE